MSTLTERLKEIMESKGWKSDQQVATVAGVSRSAVAQWLGKGSKIIHTIGNMEAAENLERETGFSALWIAKGIGPKLSKREPQSSSAWPFDEISHKKVQSLAENKKSQLEGAILLAAAQLGIDVKK